MLYNDVENVAVAKLLVAGRGFNIVHEAQF